MEKSFNNVTYNIGKMDAFEQLHVVRRLGPAVVAVLQGFMAAPEAEWSGDNLIGLVVGVAGKPLADIFSKMSNEDVSYVINACLAVCQRKQAGGYSKVMANGAIMFSDIELDTMLGLTYAVIEENLARFFPTSQSASEVSK